MKKFSFNDLLSSQTLRTFDQEIEGFGVVTMTELSGAEALDRLLEAQALQATEASEKEHQDHMNKWTARMLKGSTPTKKELEALLANLSPFVAGAIYRSGLEVNSASPEAKEELEKN